MNLSDEAVEGMVDAVQHALGGNGPASLTLFQPGTGEPVAVVFIIPAPAGPLVNTFLNDLYALLGWRTERT